MTDRTEYIRSRKAELGDLRSEKKSTEQTLTSPDQAKMLDDLDRKISALEREIATLTQNP